MSLLLFVADKKQDGQKAWTKETSESSGGRGGSVLPSDIFRVILSVLLLSAAEQMWVSLLGSGSTGPGKVSLGKHTTHRGDQGCRI